MIEFMLSLPVWAGSILAMVLATVVGLAVYAVSYKLIAKYQIGELKDPASSLFRVIGILISLMLAQAFGEVVAEWNATENTIDSEIVVISDMFEDLRRFDLDGTRDIQNLLIDYTQAVVDYDWLALADDRLGEQTGALKRQVWEAVGGLEPANPLQEDLKSRLLTDVDLISDYRVTRLNQALAKPPVFIYVVIFGFLITMACFGVYPPQVPLIALVSLYTIFIGLVLYLILSWSDPFQGGIVIQPTQLENLAETLRSLK